MTKEFDVTSFESVMAEVPQYMDYLPEDKELREKMLWGFIWIAFSGRGGA